MAENKGGILTSEILRSAKTRGGILRYNCTDIPVSFNTTRWHIVSHSLRLQRVGPLTPGPHYIIVEWVSKVLSPVETVSRPVCWVEWAVNVGGQTPHSVFWGFGGAAQRL